MSEPTPSAPLVDAAEKHYADLPIPALLLNVADQLDREEHRYVERYNACPNGCVWEYTNRVIVPTPADAARYVDLPNPLLVKTAGPDACDLCDQGTYEDDDAPWVDAQLAALRRAAAWAELAEASLADLRDRVARLPYGVHIALRVDQSFTHNEVLGVVPALASGAGGVADTGRYTAQRIAMAHAKVAGAEWNKSAADDATWVMATDLRHERLDAYFVVTVPLTADVSYPSFGDEPIATGGTPRPDLAGLNPTKPVSGPGGTCRGGC